MLGSVPDPDRGPTLSWGRKLGTDCRVWGPRGARPGGLRFSERQRCPRRRATGVGTVYPAQHVARTPQVFAFVTCLFPSASSAPEWTWSSESLPLTGPQFPLCTSKGLTRVSSCVLGSVGGRLAGPGQLP